MNVAVYRKHPICRNLSLPIAIYHYLSQAITAYDSLLISKLSTIASDTTTHLTLPSLSFLFLSLPFFAPLFSFRLISSNLISHVSFLRRFFRLTSYSLGSLPCFRSIAAAARKFKKTAPKNQDNQNHCASLPLVSTPFSMSTPHSTPQISIRSIQHSWHRGYPAA